MNPSLRDHHPANTRLRTTPRTAFAFISLMLAFGIGTSRAVPVSLTANAPGSLVPSQSFNETRGVDVTVLSTNELAVSSMTLAGLGIGSAESAPVGARIYATATQTLVASGNSQVTVGGAVTVPLEATLLPGTNYRICFHVATDPEGIGSGTFVNNSGGFPYTEPTGFLRINSAHSGPNDTFPSSPNIFVPQITLEATVIPAVDDQFSQTGVAFGASGFVRATAVQPDGKILATGVAGNAFITRLDSTGAIDPEFAPPSLDTDVFALGVQVDGKVLLGGHGDVQSGEIGISRLLPNGADDPGFTPGILAPASATVSVNGVTIQPNGRIIVAGDATTFVPAFSTTGIIKRLLPGGAIDPDFNATANDIVRGTIVQPDGKILVWGDFTEINGQAAPRIARLEENGARDTTFNPSATGGSVNCAALQADGAVVIGGQFNTVNGQPRLRLARIDTHGVLDPGFTPAVQSDGVTCITLQADGRIVLGGYFTNVAGATRNRVARLNPNGTLDSVQITPNGAVFSIMLQKDGKILVGGPFSQINGAPANRLARLHNRPATESIIITGNQRIQWLRGGAAPEALSVSFEKSADGGTTWTLLGHGERIPSGWEISGLALAGNLQLRATARVAGGEGNGSTGLVTTLATFSPIFFTAPPAMARATATEPARFSTTVNGPPGAVIKLEASTDLGLTDEWQVVGQTTLNGSGEGSFTNVEDPGSIGGSNNFYRLRLD